MNDAIRNDLNALRHRLLDLTLHNRLLNYRALKHRSVSIIDERPAEIYDFLVLNEKLMFFRPAPEASEPADTNGADSDEPVQIWRMPAPDSKVKDRHTDRYLQTELSSEVLQKTLFQTHKEAASVLEEQGYTVLFLALGFLEWYDENTPDRPRRAPLILVPVDLNRASVGAPFRINWTGEDIMGNISLRARLRDSDIDLPEFTMPEDKVEINAYLKEVSDSISGKEGWQVMNDCVLGFFSFTKFVMYNDLDPEMLPDYVSYSDNPIFRTIFQGSQPPATGDRPPVYPRGDVMDADPSQIDVIDGAAEGHHLLVEGPPGTGKSQTILNVIARLLAEGKRVLFVSEKMAALEVVKHRLDRIGLGEFCLEVHSRYSSRKGVLKQLDDTLRMDAPRLPDTDAHDSELTELTGQLDAYVEALHSPFGKIGICPYEMVGQVEHSLRAFETGGNDLPALRFTNPDEITSDQLRGAEEAIGELATLLDTVAPINTHPWYGCSPGKLFEDERIELANALRQYQEALGRLLETAKSVAECMKCEGALTLNLIRDMQHALSIIPFYSGVSAELLREPSWNGENKKAAKLISKLAVFQRQREKVLAVFNEDIIDSDIDQLSTETERFAGRFLRFFQPSFYGYRKTVKRMLKGPFAGYDRFLADLSLVQVLQDTRGELKELSDDYAYMFGDLWQGEDSMPGELSKFMGWIIEIRQLACSGCLSDAALDLIATGHVKDKCGKLLEELSSSLDELNTLFNAIEKWLKPDDHKVYGGPAGAQTLEAIDGVIKRWLDNLDRLPRWSDFSQSIERCRLSAASPLLDYIDEPVAKGSDLLPAFRGRFYGELLKSAIRIRQPLNDFNADLHEAKIRRFQHADKRAIELNRLQLAADLYKRLPIITGCSPNSQAGILNAQLNRKRGHMPIRQLLRHCGPIIQRVKPCFMMSPLSIAQFLQPGELMFDAVIFDEASQVRPEEAVGAFLRADQLIVMGDSKQLPPTSFFDRLTADDDEEEYDTPSADMESLLTLCRGRLAEKPLQWHYRSRHHSLIAVSNRESYDDQLMVFPSPFESHPYLGLFLKHIPENHYDRGKTRMNRGEAASVVQAIFEHFREHPDKSLGVATFSVSQRVAIEQELELRLQEQPELETLLSPNDNEPFFIKNLETVQGDERDVIFISVGYGFDKESKLTMNFGPLNQDGGERRLNVLITRARERCLVFSNFKASDLRIAETSPRGVHYLHSFLTFAENRNFNEPTPIPDVPSASLESFIAKDLQALGNAVVPHLGCRRFNLDLAVRGSDDPGTFCMGVEFDGQQYATSKLTRERDRLRPEILSRMGWHLERVWSIDWFRARKATAQRLQDAIGCEPASEDHRESTIGFHLETVAREPAGSHLLTDYLECEELGIDTSMNLLSSSPHVLGRAIQRVVDVEGPIHVDNAIRRVRELWGLKQTGAKIKEALESGIQHAASDEIVEVRGDFLWTTDDKVLMVRRRGDIDWNQISDEEIALAARIVLSRQYATPEDELVRETIYLFGPSRTGEESINRVGTVIQELKSSGTLRAGYGGRLEQASLPGHG